MSRRSFAGGWNRRARDAPPYRASDRLAAATCRRPRRWPQTSRQAGEYTDRTREACSRVVLKIKDTFLTLLMLGSRQRAIGAIRCVLGAGRFMASEPSASRGGAIRHIERRGCRGASWRRADGANRAISLYAPGQTVRDNSSRLQMTGTHSENPSIVTADISKWISGEAEVFFDLPQTPPSVTVDSNPGAERSTARLSIRKFAHPAIAAVVGAVTFVASVCYVIPMRHSVEPLSAGDANSQRSDGRATSRPAVVPLPVADVRSQPSDDGATSTIARAVGDAGWSTPLTPSATEIIPTPAMPSLNQPTTTLSNAQVAAFLSEVGTWYDWRTKAATAPERKPSSPHRAAR
jgi:hypothetical protein